jgi:UDP-N-acetylmuramate--alanine ligase
MDKVPFYGAVTACMDNPLLGDSAPRHRRVFTYGVAAEADYRLEFLDRRAGNVRALSGHDRAGPLGPLSCMCPAATTCSTPRPPWPSPTSLGFRRRRLPRGSATFAAWTGASSCAAQARGVTVVDDYGHHPTEIRATLAAARECGYQKIHVVFQPHRYTRTLDLMDQFTGAFVMRTPSSCCPSTPPARSPSPA